jgi:hypothetical protein
MTNTKTEQERRARKAGQVIGDAMRAGATEAELDRMRKNAAKWIAEVR